MNSRTTWISWKTTITFKKAFGGFVAKLGMQQTIRGIHIDHKLEPDNETNINHRR
jgi:hypothetical protein